MWKDNNKGITIKYNVLLNLPQRISRGADSIVYIYDASGAKLCKKVYMEGLLTSKVDYCGESEFYDGSIKYLHTEEGMVEFQSLSSFTYEYFLKDHLGNTRAVISADGSGNLVIGQVDSYYAFGMEHTGIPAISNPGSDNKYLYNGKEKQGESLGGVKLDWYDYGARFYDPQIGRWHNVDKIAESYYRHSPYSYSFNNPIKYYDPNGMWPAKFHNKMIDEVFKNILSPSQIAILKKASNRADDNEFQGTELAFQHGMGADGLSPSDTKLLYDSFISGQLVESLKAIDFNSGLDNLGFAFHAIMDNSSPTHKGFQIWKGYIHEKWFGLAHLLGEGEDAYEDPNNRPDIIIAEQEMKQLYDRYLATYGKVIVLGEVTITAEDPKKKLQRQVEDMLWKSVRPNANGNTGSYNKPGRSTDQNYSDDFLKWYYNDPK